MRRKLLMLAGIAIAVVFAGCSSSGSARAAPDESTCFDISSAKDSLMLSTKPDNARKNADVLEKYNPPDAVKAAIEHFVTTVGATPGDPDLDANRTLIANWLKQMCPNVTTY